MKRYDHHRPQLNQSHSHLLPVENNISHESEEIQWNRVSGCVCEGRCPRCSNHTLERDPSQPLEKQADLAAMQAMLSEKEVPVPGDVVIHTDNRAAQQAERLGARAFTLGNHIYFNQGEYAPDQKKGKALLAHELAHVKQQQSGVYSKGIQCSSKKKNPSDRLQREDVAIVIGSPSYDVNPPKKSLEKKDLEIWLAAAKAFAPTVYHGYDMTSALKPLRKHQKPIKTLYIIAHSVNDELAGRIVKKKIKFFNNHNTMINVMQAAVGNLGARAPRLVHLLSCHIGTSPIAMGNIGRVFGANLVRASYDVTSLQGKQIDLENGKKLSKKDANQMPLEKLKKLIKDQGYLKYYNYIPHAPFIPKGYNKKIAESRRLTHLADLYKKTGWIVYVSFGGSKDGRDKGSSFSAAEIKRHHFRGLVTSTYKKNDIVEVMVSKMPTQRQVLKLKKEDHFRKTLRKLSTMLLLDEWSISRQRWDIDGERFLTILHQMQLDPCAIYKCLKAPITSEADSKQ